MHRMRPILLTAAAASLALIPIAREVFWGPMAYAMMGGIIVGTALTLLFLPALYVAWFRVPTLPLHLLSQPAHKRLSNESGLEQFFGGSTCCGISSPPRHTPSSPY